MFSLTEALVALALTVTLIGAAVPLVSSNSAVAASAPEVVDEQQRARLGADAVARDLAVAGAGLSVSPHAGSLLSFFAPIVPRRLGQSGADAFNVARSDAITIIYATSSPAQSVLLVPMTSAADPLQVDASIGCPAGTQVCGLQQGSTALLFDESGRFDLVSILSLQGSAASVAHRQQGSPSFVYQPGAAVAEAVQHTYYFDPINLQLRHSDGASTDVPIVDDVVAVSFAYFGSPHPPVKPKPQVGIGNCLYDSAGNLLAGMPTLPSNGGSLASLPLSMFTDGPWCAAGSNRFDADLLRVRLVRVALRVQVGNPMMRGASAAFAVSGLSRGARTIPDYEVRFDVAPRNMSLGR